MGETSFAERTVCKDKAGQSGASVGHPRRRAGRWRGVEGGRTNE
nr:MAG TPA: hypothetical protein [Caudoviricetes sp.]